MSCLDNSVFRRSPDVLFREVESNLKLIHLKDPSVELYIDGIAKIIWLNIDGTRTLKKIARDVFDSQKLAQKYRAKFNQDVNEFVQALLDSNLIA